jgi:hypothetical protein
VNAIVNVSGNRLTSEQLARLRAAVAAYEQVRDAYVACEDDEEVVKGVAAQNAWLRLRKTLTALGLAAVPPELWDGAESP